MRTEARVIAHTPVGVFWGRWKEVDDKSNFFDDKAIFTDGDTMNDRINKLNYFTMETTRDCHANLPGEVVRNSVFEIEFREVSDFLENVD